MLLYCSRFKKLTFDNMNSTFGLELHRSYWLEGVHEIGSFAESCNYLDDMQLQPESHSLADVLRDTRRALVPRGPQYERPLAGRVVQRKRRCNEALGLI